MQFVVFFAILLSCCAAHVLITSGTKLRGTGSVTYLCKDRIAVCSESSVEEVSLRSGSVMRTLYNKSCESISGHVIGKEKFGEIRYLGEQQSFLYRTDFTLPFVTTVAHDESGNVFASNGYTLVSEQMLGYPEKHIYKLTQQEAPVEIQHSSDFLASFAFYNKKLYTASGRSVKCENQTLLTITGQVASIAVDWRSGALYTLDSVTGDLWKLQLNVCTTQRSTAQVVAHFEANAKGLAITPSHIVVTAKHNRIWTLDKVTGEIDTILSSRIASPAGLAVSENNTLYIADMHRLVVITEGVQTSVSFVDLGEISNVVVDSDFVYICDTKFGNIAVLAKDALVRVQTFTGFKQPVSIVRYAEESWFVSEAATDSVLRIVGLHNYTVSRAFRAYLTPVDMQLVGDTLYFTSFGNRWVSGRLYALNITSEEVNVMHFGLLRPKGLAVAKSGCVFVAETGRKRILHICDRLNTTVVLDNVDFEAEKAETPLFVLPFANIGHFVDLALQGDVLYYSQDACEGRVSTILL